MTLKFQKHMSPQIFIHCLLDPTLGLLISVVQINLCIPDNIMLKDIREKLLEPFLPSVLSCWCEFWPQPVNGVL